MKLCSVLAMVALLCGVDVAQAQHRVAVRDPKLLLIAAIDAPSGQAQGVLSGDVADAITQRFKGTTPIYIDVSTERRYAQAGCSAPQGQPLAGRRATARQLRRHRAAR